MSTPSSLYIGLMSGTSLDGVDGVIASFSPDSGPGATLADAYLPFDQNLRNALLALQAPGASEIHREALAANAVAECYAECVTRLLSNAGVAVQDIVAIGAHGQTIRHRPEHGYTWQTINPALLAERTGIDVVADFRSRDIAAAGQGAPLVPAFHHAVFSDENETRVVANIGGVANISILAPGRLVTGFDTGPGNVLMDTWIHRHRRRPYDHDGAWAASGAVHEGLLGKLCSDAYFTLPPPKSTGRDLFNAEWLDLQLEGFADLKPEDVQATLTAFTATTLADAIVQQTPDVRTVYACGGGAYNLHLLSLLRNALTRHGCAAKVETTVALNVPPNQVEALAFAWLAFRHVNRQAGNLPAVTGARGERILGALYPR